MADTVESKLYSPLESGQIRLFSFHEQDLEHLHLQIFHLDDCPTYAALSYRWGDASQRTKININGISKDIHNNLAEALRSVLSQTSHQGQQMRMTLAVELPEANLQSPILYFWADGICINQDNLAERGQQVQIMGDIFSQAACVLPHLMDDRCMASMKLLYELFSEPMEASHTTIAEVYTGNLATLGPFMREPYWKRVWIVPEIVLAREICVLCGTRAMSLSPLRTAMVVNSAIDLQVTVPFISVMSRKWNIRVLDVRHNGRPGFYNLSEWLYYLQDAQCSDERDRIYSLIGCVDWKLSSNIKPLQADYTISTGELFRRVVELHIADGGYRIGLLRYALRWRDADHSLINSFLEAQNRNTSNQKTC